MLRISQIAFPGFGIGEFSVDSVAFMIGNIDIAWYAIIIALGMVAAIAYVIFKTKKIGLTADDIIDYALFTIPIGVVGARLYYVFSKPENFNSLRDVFNLRSGGLAIYGGIIAGAITVYVVSRVKKIPFLALADCAAPAVILAQAIGRFGNFMNGEAFGAETDIFCRMQLMNSLTGYKTVCVHPTFLYESLWNIIGFTLINVFYKKKKYDGQWFLITFGWYGLGRMFIEGLRSDSLYASIFGINFRISQVLAGAIFITTLAILLYLKIKKYKGEFYVKAAENKTQKRK